MKQFKIFISNFINRFPKRTKTLLSTYNHLQNFYDNVKSQPNIKAYLESGRRLKYSDGVFRHYDELDDE